MATNPYVNKVEKADGTVIMDISDTTAEDADVASGKVYYKKSGARSTGTYNGGDKADKVSGATAGDLAGLDATGNLTDSGYAPDDLIEVLEYANQSSFPVTGESGKLYIDLATNYVFRWDETGTEYVMLAGGGGGGEAGGGIIDVSGTVTNTSGSYSGTFNDVRVTSGMKAIMIEVGTPTVFNADISVTCNDGSITVTCSDVAGTSTIKVSVIGSYVNSTEYQVLSAGKADKVSGATANNFAALDANGNLTDSGKKAADFASTDTATQSAAGLMSAADKTVLDGLDGLVSDGNDSTAITDLSSYYTSMTNHSYSIRRFGANSTAAPYTGEGIVISYKYSGNYGNQQAITDDGTYLRVLDNGTWESWQKVAMDSQIAPVALGSITTLAALETALLNLYTSKEYGRQVYFTANVTATGIFPGTYYVGTLVKSISTSATRFVVEMYPSNDNKTIKGSYYDDTFHWDEYAFNSNLKKLDSNSNETTDVLADALLCTKTTFFKGAGSTYTGTVPNSNYKWGAFIVNVRGSERYVIATSITGEFAVNVYNSGWGGWKVYALDSTIAFESINNIDVNTLTATKHYFANSGCTNIPANYMFLRVYAVSSSVVNQIATKLDGTTYQRVYNNGTWTSWEEIALQSQLSYYRQTDGLLKQLSTGYDLDTLRETGRFWCTGYVANRPLSINGCVDNYVYAKSDGGYVKQVYTTLTGNRMFQRSRDGNNGWSSWEELVVASNSVLPIGKETALNGLNVTSDDYIRQLPSGVYQVSQEPKNDYMPILYGTCIVFRSNTNSGYGVAVMFSTGSGASGAFFRHFHSAGWHNSSWIQL